MHICIPYSVIIIEMNKCILNKAHLVFSMQPDQSTHFNDYDSRFYLELNSLHNYAFDPFSKLRMFTICLMLSESIEL